MDDGANSNAASPPGKRGRGRPKKPQTGRSATPLLGCDGQASALQLEASAANTHMQGNMDAATESARLDTPAQRGKDQVGHGEARPDKPSNDPAKQPAQPMDNPAAEPHNAAGAPETTSDANGKVGMNVHAAKKRGRGRPRKSRASSHTPDQPDENASGGARSAEHEDQPASAAPPAADQSDDPAEQEIDDPAEEGLEDPGQDPEWAPGDAAAKKARAGTSDAAAEAEAGSESDGREKLSPVRKSGRKRRAKGARNPKRTAALDAGDEAPDQQTDGIQEASPGKKKKGAC